MKNTEQKLKDLQKVRMTEAESISIRRNLIAFMEQISPSTKKMIASPFMQLLNPVFVTAFSFLFIIFGGSALAYHASDSLPGDTLYNFKVKVNEEVAGVLIQSPKAKILWEQNRIAKRLEEVKKLADTDSLTPQKVAIVEKNIDTHIAKIEEKGKVLAEKDPDEFIEASTGLKPILEAHEKEIKEEKMQEEVDKKKVQAVEKSAPKVLENPSGTTTIEPETTLDSKNSLQTPEEKKAVAEPMPAVTEKTAGQDKIEENKKVVESIIQKVQKESDKLEEIAEPLVEQKKTTQEVKNSVIKTEPIKEINVEKPTLTP